MCVCVCVCVAHKETATVTGVCGCVCVCVCVCVCLCVLKDPQKRHVYDTEGEAAVRSWEERAQQVSVNICIYACMCVCVCKCIWVCMYVHTCCVLPYSILRPRRCDCFVFLRPKNILHHHLELKNSY